MRELYLMSIVIFIGILLIAKGVDFFSSVYFAILFCGIF